MRVRIAEFGIIQRSLAGATVAIYEADEAGRNTGVLATLYVSDTGPEQTRNPQTLDENGKFAGDVYVEDTTVIAAISNISPTTERSIRKIRVNPLEYPLPITSAQLAGDTAQVIIPNLDDIIAVANNIAAVVGVDANEANINTVAADLGGADTIGTVATNIMDVQAVGSNIAAVLAVNANETNINAVNANKANIDTVADDLNGDNNIGAVGSNIAAVVAVNANATNINAVNANATNINNVASNMTAVLNVDTNMTSVTSLATNMVALLAIEDDLTELNAIYANLAELNDIHAALPALGDIYTNLAAVTNVSTNMAAVQSADTNMAAIIAAPTAASAAAASAVEAANYAQALKGTSTSSVEVGSGSKTFTTEADRQWFTGLRLRVSNPGLTRIMTGTVTSYSGTTLQINVDYVEGIGTDDDWTIQISGERGEPGAGGLTDGDYGDIVATGSGTILTVKNGLDAAKIGAGAVSSTEFGYLDGVTSAIQTQLNAKANESITVSAGTGLTGGGDLTANLTIALNSASIAALNLAYSAVQPGDLGALAMKNTVGNSDIDSNVDAVKIANGSVSNTEFQYLDGVTSAIQTQLNGKQATGNYITALTGDVTAAGPGSVAATIANNAVTTAKINNAAVSNGKLADMATQTIKGRNTAGSGSPEDLSVATVKGMLGGTAIGDLVQLANVGGSPGLPAIDGSLLTGIATAEWDLVDTVVISSPVSAVTLTDLDEWRDIMVMQVDITTSSNGARRMRVSANNGSSFLTEFLPTDSATRQEWNVTSSGTGSSAARSGGTIIYNFNTTDPVKPVVPLGRAATTSVSIAVATASVLNCVQVANSAGNLTGGTIYIFGRK